MATLTLEEFLPKARQLNPDYTDDEHIQAYEQRYGRSKPVQTVSPAPLTTFEAFLPKARALNPDYSDEEHYAAWHEKYGARGAREKDQGDFVRGGVTAFKQVPQTIRGLEAGAGAIGEKIAGAGGLFTALKEHGLKGYQEHAADIAKDSKPSDSVTEAYKMAKAGDAGALVDWLQYALGYDGGQALQMLATAGIGYAGGKLALQPAARTLADKMIAKESARLAATGMAGEQLAKQAVSNVAGKIGQTAVLAGTAVGMEGGEIYGGLVEKAAQEERSLTGEELAKATGATLGAGILEFVGDKIGLDLILGKSVAGKLVSSRLGHATGAGALGLVTESGTEFTQTLLEELGKGNDPLAPEAIKQAVDAAAMGGVGGASMGAAGGLLSRPQGRSEDPIVTERAPEDMGMGKPTEQSPSGPLSLEGPPQPGELRKGTVYAPGAVLDVSPLPDVSPVLKAGSLDEAIAHAVGVVQGATETGKARAAEFARMTAKAKNETDELLANAPEKRPAFDVPTLPGPEAQPATLLNQPSPIIPGQAFTPRPEPVDDPRARLAEERARLVAQREQQRMQPPANPVSEPVAPTPAVAQSDTPLPSQIDLAYPSSKQVRDLIHEKGFHLDTPVFREYLKMAVGKEKFSDLTPQELQNLAEKVQKIKAPQQPTPTQEAPPQVPLTPAKERPYAPVTTIPEAQVPRSELTPEKNAEMLLRAEKAKADMEIAGTERGGRFFQEQPGTGSTQEVSGLKSATADWYKDLTSGPSPAIRGDRKQSAREKIEVAIAKIIKDQGADRGKAVEQVKAALLQDQEFHKTEWGRDLNSIMQGQWPEWIEKPVQSKDDATASWVIRNKTTGEVIQETFNPQAVEKLNKEKYEAIPAQEYLGSINTEEKRQANAEKFQKVPQRTPDGVGETSNTSPGNAISVWGSDIKDTVTSNPGKVPMSRKERLAQQKQKMEGKAGRGNDPIDALIAQYIGSGRVAVRYPRRKTVSVDGREMAASDAVIKMKGVLANDTKPEPSPSNAPEMETQPATASPERAPAPSTSETAPKIEEAVKRGEIGKSLTPEQRTMVLKTLKDVYYKQADRELKGVDNRGEEVWGYVYTPDLFVQSNITGRMVRFYVTLPDGRIAHPTELFPGYTENEIERDLRAQRNQEELSKKEQDSRRASLMARKDAEMNDANRKFWARYQNSMHRPEPEDTVALTNGKEFIRTTKAFADRDLSLLGEEWSIHKPSDPKRPETAEEPFSLSAPEVSKPKAKDTGPEQLGIEIPPETIGSRPIIRREATHEEAPLFSKNSQTPDAEQTTLSEPIENTDDALMIPKQDSGSVKEPWEMTRQEFKLAENRPKVEAIHQAILSGKQVVLATQYRGLRLTNPDQIKLDPNGDVRIRSGKEWLALTDGQIEGLARQSGIPSVPLQDKVFHRSAVREALDEGKPVPLEVLADYPDLQQVASERAQSIAPDITPAQSSPAQSPETAQSPTEILAEALRTAADRIYGKQVPADEGQLPKQSQQKANEKVKRDGGLLNVNPARPQFDERNTERAEPTMAQFAQAFAEGAPIAGTAQKVIDSSQEFPKEMIEALSAKRYVRELTEELGKVFNSMKRVLVQSDPDTFSPVTFSALSPDSYYYGVNLRGPDQMILNPWTALHQVQQGVQEGFIGEEEVPEYLAGNLIKTLVHEFTHQQVTTTHQDERQPYFLAAEQRNRAILGSRLAMMQRQLMAVLTGGTNGTVEGIRDDLKQQQAFWKEGDGLSAMDQSVSPKPTYARRRQRVSGEGASGRTGPPTYLRGSGESETLPLGESAGLRRSGAESGTIDPTQARNRLKEVSTSLRPYLLGSLGLEQLSQVYGNDHAEVKAYNRATQAMEADFTEMSRESDKVARSWTDLKIPVADKMAQVMEDARFLNFDPDPKKSQEIDSEKKQKLRERFDQLPEDAKSVYRMARDFYTNMAEQRFQALKERIERAGGTPENTRKLVDRLQLAYEQVRSKVYFPFSRFGENIVVAKQMKDGKEVDREVHAFESVAEAQKFATMMKLKGWQVKQTVAREYSVEKEGPASKIVRQMHDIIKELGQGQQGLPGVLNLEDQLLDSLNQSFLQALPDMSYAKHFIHAKDVKGASKDALRAFAHSALHGSHHISRIRHADKVTKALMDLDQNINETGEGDTTEARQVYNELVKRHNDIMNPNTHPVSAWLGQLGFTMSLGGVVATGITNATQVPLVTYPWMGARYGFGKASAALARAYKDFLDPRTLNKDSLFDATKSKLISESERKMLLELARRGHIDLTQTMDLAGLSSRDNLSRKARTLGTVGEKVTRMLGFTFHVPEVMNRQVTALSTFRLEKEKGGSFEEALERAQQAIIDTHFLYQSFNRARYMQGNFLRVLTMFKQYSQNIAFTYGRAASIWLDKNGATKEEQRVAKRQLASMLALQFGAAGALGMPFFGTPVSLIMHALGAMGDDDEERDWEVALRKWLDGQATSLAEAFIDDKEQARAVGKELAEVVSHGASRLTPWDMAGRLGQNDLFVREPQREREGRQAVMDWMLALGGPVPSYGVNFLLGMGDVAKGVSELNAGFFLRGVEELTPAVLRHGVKSLRYTLEGVRTRDEYKQLELNTSEQLGQVFGFTPSRVAEMYESTTAVKNKEHRILNEQKSLKNRFARAVDDQDDNAKQRILEDIRGFNERNPIFAITSDTLNRSLKARRQHEAGMERGMYLPPRRRALLEEGDFGDF